jgi:hypothetical protein
MSGEMHEENIRFIDQYEQAEWSRIRNVVEASTGLESYGPYAGTDWTDELGTKITVLRTDDDVLVFNQQEVTGRKSSVSIHPDAHMVAVSGATLEEAADLDISPHDSAARLVLNGLATHPLFKGKIERAETPGATDTIESPESPSSHRLWQTVFAIEMLGDRERGLTVGGEPEAVTRKVNVVFDTSDTELASFTLGYHFQSGDGQFDKGEYWPEVTAEYIDKPTGETKVKGKYVLVDETRAAVIYEPDSLDSFADEPSTELHAEMLEILESMRDELLDRSDLED